MYQKKQGEKNQLVKSRNLCSNSADRSHKHGRSTRNGLYAGAMHQGFRSASRLLPALCFNVAQFHSAIGYAITVLHPITVDCCVVSHFSAVASAAMAQQKGALLQCLSHSQFRPEFGCRHSQRVATTPSSQQILSCKRNVFARCAADTVPAGSSG